MNFKKVKIPIIIALLMIFSNSVFAHCDGIDGPVVTDAKKALETKDVNYVLGWIMPEYEDQIIDAFNKTLKVREMGTEAKELADYYFFETVVRLHRLGEGAPYTGLKPAGRDLGPAITGADKSIESGELKEVYDLLNESMHHKLHSLFDDVVEKKNYNKDNLEDFREYVEAYVKYIHYVEELYDISSGNHKHGEDKNSEENHL